MSHPVSLKPTHKAIQTYYATLEAYREHHVGHETALRSAFQNLLADTARTHHWFLVPEQSNQAGGKRIVPDGTLLDEHHLHRGYWEAKDTRDDLDEEIAKKIKKGYPLRNIIFEDTRQAVLFQDRREVLRIDLTQPQNLADLLNYFGLSSSSETLRKDIIYDVFYNSRTEFHSSEENKKLSDC